jgi:GTP-binding protein LepA
MTAKIRNFAIIAHVDHGKSTLADRLLEITGTVPKNKMVPQYLDRMDLERERGITIKLAPVTMEWRGYTLNLIDTPGHVDFSYEVSRTLAAVEGAILLVDATQGVQAQTLSNLHLARSQGLTIIPVVNKIDLPSAEMERTVDELAALLSVPKESVLKVSGKTGEGVEGLLSAIAERIPAPKSNPNVPFRALVFDSIFDTFRGVVVYVRIFDGKIEKGAEVRFQGTGTTGKTSEIGVFSPDFLPKKSLETGAIGYLVTNLKEIRQARVGDTVAAGDVDPLPGYLEPQPMVFASFFTESGTDFGKLRDALGKLHLSDSSLSFEPTRSQALGPGFKVGVLGLLHLEIVKERLEREYGLSLVVTTPQVHYEGKEGDWKEPWVKLEIITPSQYLGSIQEAIRERRGVLLETKTLSGDRLLLTFEIPLAEMIVDFYDLLKSLSSGYASMNYELVGYRPGDLVRLDILVAEDPIEAFSQIVPREFAARRGREIVERLKILIPRQLFEVKIQAAAGSKILASEKIPPLRKDVTAKLYGGDRTRKDKLLQKQKAGKKRMKRMGKVDIPTDVFLKLLKR